MRVIDDELTLATSETWNKKLAPEDTLGGQFLSGPVFAVEVRLSGTKP